MKFSTLLSPALLALSVRGDSFPWERLSKNDSLLLVVDHQEGLFHLARDWDPTVFKHNILAHAAIGKVFGLPTVLTTSAETGPNGRLPQEIIDMHPNAPIIRRQGEVNAWDNAEFREAVRATNKTQVIIGGIVTDVCTAFLARSLRAEGYSVWANLEASGTINKDIRDAANAELSRAGVQVVSLFAIFGDLMRDWRHVPGSKELQLWLDTWMPAAGMLSRAHRAAVVNGTIQPGQEDLPF